MTAAGEHLPPGSLVVGVGVRRSAGAAAVRRLLDDCLDAAGLEVGDVAVVVTVQARAEQPAVLDLAGRLGVPLRALPPDLLATQPAPTPSAVAMRAVGTASVAEAAVLASGARLLVPKRVGATATVAVGRMPGVAPAGGPDLRHHGDAELAPGLVDLAVNVRPGTPPAWLADRLRAAVGDLARYPDPAAATAAVAARHGRRTDEVLLTAGAAEAFVLLARALRPRRAVVVHPQFTEPEAALLAAGHEVHRVLLPPPFRLDPAAVPAEADLVVVGNPTNPTSVLHPAADLARLARPGRVLVVDEAFMDAVPGEAESLAGPQHRGLPGLVVVRSLTKTWGLAGLRVGYLLGDPAVLAACAAAQPLWPVGTLALAAAAACVGEAARAESAAWADTVAAHRVHLLDALAAVPGVDPVDVARAPFVLLRVTVPAGGPLVRDRLRAAGWAVRRGDTFPGLGPDWLRVAVRDPGTTDRFTAALRNALTRPDDTLEVPDAHVR